VEHGHQYDPLCASEHVIMPVSPSDPRRIARGFCDVLLRFVVRPTKGMPEYGHDRMGVLDYLAFGARLGVRGLFKLAMGFGGAVLELLRVRRAFLSDAAKHLREEHERRMALLAEATRIGIDRLRALAALQAPPVTRSIRGILATVLLDRLALALSAVVALIVLAVWIGLHHGSFWLVGGCVVVAWTLTHLYLTRLRKLDYDDQLVERAGALAKLFPAAFVVMGHTHTPAEIPIGAATTYVNVGSWSEGQEHDEGAPEWAYRAARTHLVIHPGDSGPVAEFLAWSPDGPRRYVGVRAAKKG
jgi:hypothetical protein